MGAAAAAASSAASSAEPGEAVAVSAWHWSFDLTSPQGESPYFAVFEVEWDYAEAMAASLSSPEAVATDMSPDVTEGTVFLNSPCDGSASPAARRKPTRSVSVSAPSTQAPQEPWGPSPSRVIQAA